MNFNPYEVYRYERFGPFKEPGHLNLPRPALEQVAASLDFPSRVFCLFSELIETNERWAGWTANLETDPRVAALKGRMISTGSSAGLFEPSRLAMWYVWYANEVGVETAQQHLERWLDADEVDVVNALWVHGLDVDEEIPLRDGFCITPAKLLPDSTHKEQALQFKTHHSTNVVSFPSVAITQISRVKKTASSGGPTDMAADRDFWAAQRRLYDIASVLNALPGVSCLPAFASSYSHPTNPLGPFSGSGASIHFHDVIGRGQTRISLDQRDDVLGLLDDYYRLSSSDQERYRLIFSRLSQGKRRSDIKDKILDLGIALEMLLLSDNANHDQLSLSFRLRGAWLVSSTLAERINNYKLLKQLYTYRSQVAHSGLLEGGKPEKIRRIREKFSEYESLAEKICCQLLKVQQVDWGSIVLGANI